MSTGHLVAVDDAAGWSRALEGLPVGFGHDAGYVRAAARAIGAQAWLWCLESAGGARAACPVLWRRDAAGSDVATPWGFAGLVCDPALARDGEGAVLAAAWAASWRSRGVLAAYAQLAPWVAPASTGSGWDAFGGAWSAGPDCLWWDLAPDPQALLAAMQSKHRQLLRKWLREDARPEFDQAVLLEAFQALYPEFVERAGVSAAYRFDAEAIAGIAGAPGAFFVGARGDDGALEAVTLFASTQGRGDSLLNAATPLGRRHSRGLYWLGALALRERGATSMNLGGALAAGDGLGDFKLRLGATPRPTRVLRQVIDAVGFADACARAGRPPSTRFFPPWRAPAP